jgi:hypothetical protein
MNLGTDPRFDRQINPNVPAAKVDEDISLLKIAVEGINGPSTFNLETAAYGYIKSYEKVVYPATLRNKIEQATTFYNIPANYGDTEEVPDLHFFDLLTITFWNKRALENAGIPEDTAFFIGFYRARLTYLGYMYTSKADRSVTVDEVEWRDDAIDYFQLLRNNSQAFEEAYNDADTLEDEIRAFIEHSTEETLPYSRFLLNVVTTSWIDMIQHIVLAAQQYAAMTYLVFRQMGHHYTVDYEAKYDIMWKATTLMKPAFVPSNEMLHRVAIHSFGLKTLHEKFYQNLSASKLAETFVDRSDVAPAGTAIITTCNAAIQLMRSLPLWDTFYMAYKVTIDSLEAQSKALKGTNAATAIRFHKNARLFGAIREIPDTKFAEALASYAKGFIQSLGPRSDLSKQRTLDKKANQNPINVTLMASLIESAADKIIESGDLSSIIPKMPARESATTPATATIREVAVEGAVAGAT